MVIMLLGHLMVQGTRASAGGETFPVRQARGFHRVASEAAFLQSLDQVTSGSALPVDAAPVGLARYDIVVSQGTALLFRAPLSRYPSLPSCLLNWLVKQIYNAMSYFCTNPGPTS